MRKLGIAILMGLGLLAMGAGSAQADSASAADHSSCATVRPKSAKVLKQNAHIVVWSRKDPEARLKEHWACARGVGKRVAIGWDYSSEESYGYLKVKRLNKSSLVTRYTQVFDCEQTVTVDKFNLRTGRKQRLDRQNTADPECP